MDGIVTDYNLWYCFKRLPFGLACAPKIFARIFNEVFHDIPGFQNFFDDSIIKGKSSEDHDRRLISVLDRALEKGVKFNIDKCKIKQKEVKFLGHKLNSQGILIDDDKVKAVRATTISNASDLSRFLGMLTYLSRFFPHLAEKTAPLRELMRKDAQWCWTRTHELLFEEIKSLITKAPILQYFRADSPIILSVDSSSKGLGAVLLQNMGPVAYSSKTLTEIQQGYAQIEKETLAIVFGCERFKQYVYGRHFLVESDHKPLESIFQKPLDKSPLRLQRMRLRLQGYDFEVKYKPGKELYIADTLSRDSMLDDEIDLGDLDIEAQVGLIEINATPERLQQLKDETLKDEGLQKLVKLIREGWPVNRNQVPEECKPYFSYREDLTEYEGLILKGQQVVIPKSLRTEMLERIHYGHLGIQKCKLRARESVFWPFMSKEIQDVVESCSTCKDFARNNPKEPMIKMEIPKSPWQEVSSDIFTIRLKDYLIVVDKYSKFPEVVELRELSSPGIIEKLKEVFARYGVPEKLFSDNGRQYDSRQMRLFEKAWNFKLVTSSQRFPQSNGFVERHIQTVKKLIKKAEKSGRDLSLVLLEYRNTPIDNKLPSPAQLMFSRHTTSMLPIVTKPEPSKIVDREQVREQLLRRQQTQKRYFDRGTKNLPELKPLERVRVKHNGEWLTGRIHDKHGTRPRSYIVDADSGGRYERNRRHIIRDKSSKRDQVVMIDEEIGQTADHLETPVQIDRDEKGLREEAVESESRTLGSKSPDGRLPKPVKRVTFNERNNAVREFETDERVSRSGRRIKPPSYLTEYVTE